MPNILSPDANIKIPPTIESSVRRTSSKNDAERYFAIKFATKIAKPGDIVMLAWKWHEPIQRTNFWTRKRNDKEKLLEILKN